MEFSERFMATRGGYVCSCQEALTTQVGKGKRQVDSQTPIDS